MKVPKKQLVYILISVLILAIGIVLVARRMLLSPTSSSVPEGNTVKESEPTEITGNLSVPWEIASLPDGDLLVTERSGTLKRIGRDNRTYQIEGVQHTSEGGLLGSALHPKYAENGYIYLYLTSRQAGSLTNRVERYRYSSDRLEDRKVILAGIPGAVNHDGGRIAFGPDGLLYITTGDATNEDDAQNKQSLAGKILRIKDDGNLPVDNPFGNAVYSYGHRNPQGLAWDDNGQLWSTEHGRSGVRSGLDELNKIEKGANYGWPVIEGDETREGMQKPVLHSGSNDTWAPASLVFWRGSFFFGGLRGQALYEAKPQPGGSFQLKAHLKGRLGRIRAAAVSTDGHLLISTSNTDGRGDKRPGDDRILKISL